MQLIVFFTIILMIVDKVRFSILELFTPISQSLHKSCLLWLPQTSKSLPELQALVCGENFQQMNEASLYATTGLIHLFVVSGAHLLLIRKILCFHMKTSILYATLIFYCLVCQMNPPIIRALVSIFLSDSLLSGRPFWPRHLQVLIAGLLCLVLQPQWISSLSLQLSWLISLGMAMNESFFSSAHRLVQQSIQYTLIFPTLILFQTPNPFSILLNVIFSQFLEFILFPLGFLVSACPFLVPVFDFLIATLKWILTKTELSALPASFEKDADFVLVNWFLILTVHSILHFSNMIRKRNSHA